MSETTDLVNRSLGGDATPEFEERVERQAAALREAIAAGDLDNADFAVGLELEVYAVARGEDDGDGGHLTPLSDDVFDGVANKELGLHNAEINTEPNVMDGDGLAAQADSIAARFEAAQQAAREHGQELVPDAMWTIPPAAGSDPYLSGHETVDGVSIAGNMRPDPRYLAIDNEVLDLAGGDIDFSVPGVDRAFPSILFESLATSIQPHLQIPSAEDFPEYYNAAIRTLGPVLAIGTNAPFLPPDLYTDVDDPHRLVDETHHELRIAAFEQSVNVSPNPKVRVPRDLDDATEVAERVVEDDLYAPFLREWLDESPRDTFADQHWEFDYKRSTYWRWLRCVVGGDHIDARNDERSLRIEYRPIPTQPTVRDVVGMQALTTGLVRGLVATGHPLTELPWAAAEESFYSAVESGLDADLAWVTADGERTDDAETVFGEVFEYARRGLREAEVPAADVDHYLSPIEARWEAGVTPSVWKKECVRDRLDAGESLAEAIEGMQHTYIRQSRTLSSFAEWL
ncbi:MULTISPECIES: hypothetical protein [Salinibaculum]|uniref:hypothetical protein n=1 Tax=Salinibaculum TaxID=2732368 RepID=UPI0030CE16CA